MRIRIALRLGCPARTVSSSRTLAALALVAAVLPPATVAAQSVKLNGPLAQPLSGDVTGYAISPDGTRVVYRADQVLDDVFELYSAPLDGSAAAVRLHAALPDDGRAVGAFAIGAGGRVVFLADLAADERFELFSAPIDGSASPVVLSGSLPAAGDVADFRLTPDGTRAVYRADATTDGTLEVLGVAVDGSSAPLHLDPQHRPCSLYRISSSSQFVLFADDEDLDRERLYRVPLDASQAPVLLANSGAPGIFFFTHFEDVRISSDDQHAALVTVEDAFDRGGCGGQCSFDLHGLSLSGPPQSTQLNLQGISSVPRMALAGGHVVYDEFPGFANRSFYTVETDGTDRVLLGMNVDDFAVSPDESLVVFVEGGMLRIAPIDGSVAPTALAGPGSITSPRVNASSTLVLFIGTDPDTSFRGLWAVPTTGGVPLLLNGPAIPGGFGAKDFALGPVGSVVVYREDRAADERVELWSVDTELVPRNLSGPLAEFQDVLSYQISPDGQHVVHLADRNSNDSDDLFGTAIDSGDPLVQYNETSLPGGPVLGDVTSFVASPDQTHVLYRADQDSDEFFELYSVEADGSEAPVRLTGPVSEAGDVQAGFVYTPAGDRTLFAFGQSPQVLHCAPTSGAGPVVALDSAANGFVGPFSFVGNDVIYGRLGPPGSTLHRTALDGSSPPITLADPPAGSVQQFRLTPDTLTVIYQGGVPTELFRVPSDGSAAPIVISAPLVANGGVEDFRVSPDSSRVVYRADQDVNSKAELYSVPSDGSAPAVKLNGALVPAGDVSEFAITQDGARVVYRADQTADNRPELHGVPIDASAPAVRLTVLPVNREVASDFVLADGTAYYRADVAALDRFQLFRVPVDGSASPQELSAPLGLLRSVTAFALTPDQSRVVYLADTRLDEVFELFSVSASGGPVLPLVTLPAFGDVTTFRIEPQSGFVVYLADANVDGVPELFRVPLDASRPPWRLHPSLPAGGQVQPDFVPLSGGDALYRADREIDDVFELYRAFRLELDPGDRVAPFPAPTRSASTVR